MGQKLQKRGKRHIKRILFFFMYDVIYEQSGNSNDNTFYLHGTMDHNHILFLHGRIRSSTLEVSFFFQVGSRTIIGLNFFKSEDNSTRNITNETFKVLDIVRSLRGKRKLQKGVLRYLLRIRIFNTF